MYFTDNIVNSWLLQQQHRNLVVCTEREYTEKMSRDLFKKRYIYEKDVY